MICGIVGVRGEVGVREDDSDYWLDLCIPLEALCRSDTRVGGFPFELRTLRVAMGDLTCAG